MMPALPMKNLQCLLCVVALVAAGSLRAAQLEPLRHHQSDLVVDLGVGLWAWPLPMDFDKDGDLDLVVNCPDKPYNGVYFFENPGGSGPMPIFKAGRRISRGLQNVQVSYVDGRPRVLSPGREHAEFFENGLDTSRPLGPDPKLGLPGKLRANQWRYADFDGDGIQDLMVGIGDWTEYGWDDAYDASGQWTNGPLHGYVFVLRNKGGDARPDYDEPRKLEAGGRPVDVYGWPSPNLGDFDGDGDLDLLCGEFLDRFTYFENQGTRTAPRYAAGRRLRHGGADLRMDLQMILPTAIDWDRDGDLDLIVGDEDGRVALIEHTGQVTEGLPQFLPPRYFRQEADEVKFGALATPCGFDWDGDGDEDILCGNTAGYISFIENLGGIPVRWAEPRRLEADGKVLRIQAGPNGSIQGPCEAKWGYTTQTVGDWDQDGLPDLMVNSIWGRVEWYRNVGTRTKPRLAAARPVEVDWKGAPPKPAWFWWNPKGRELVTQWRTTPVLVDFNRDDLIDLVMLDHEGYLAFFERRRDADGLHLIPGRRLFVDEQMRPLRLNDKRAGGSGRRKLAATDWDGDGRIDFLLNSENATWLRNLGERDGKIILKDMGNLDARKVSGHTSSPTVIDLNRDGVPELLVGAEDGHLYYKQGR